MFKWLKKRREGITDRERWKLGMDPKGGQAKNTGHSNNFRRVVSIHNDVVIVNGKRLAKGSNEEAKALKSVGVIMGGVGRTMDSLGETMKDMGEEFKKW